MKQKLHILLMYYLIFDFIAKKRVSSDKVSVDVLNSLTKGLLSKTVMGAWESVGDGKHVSEKKQHSISEDILRMQRNLVPNFAAALCKDYIDFISTFFGAETPKYKVCSREGISKYLVSNYVEIIAKAYVNSNPGLAVVKKNDSSFSEKFHESTINAVIKFLQDSIAEYCVKGKADYLDIFLKSCVGAYAKAFAGHVAKRIEIQRDLAIGLDKDVANIILKLLLEGAATSIASKYVVDSGVVQTTITYRSPYVSASSSSLVYRPQIQKILETRERFQGL